MQSNEITEVLITIDGSRMSIVSHYQDGDDAMVEVKLEEAADDDSPVVIDIPHSGEFHNLKKLHLRNYDRDVRYIFKDHILCGLNNLEDLSLHSVSIEIDSKCIASKNLRYVALIDCHIGDITPDVDYVPKNVAELFAENCPHLETIKIIGCTGIEGTWPLNWVSLELQTVVLYNNEGLSNDVSRDIEVRASLRRLQDQRRRFGIQQTVEDERRGRRSEQQGGRTMSSIRQQGGGQQMRGRTSSRIRNSTPSSSLRQVPESTTIIITPSSQTNRRSSRSSSRSSRRRR